MARAWPRFVVALGLLILLATSAAVAPKPHGTRARKGKGRGRRCTEPGDTDRVAAMRAGAEAECGCQGAIRHGRYVRCVASLVSDAVHRAGLRPACANLVLRCEKRSVCGRRGVVACCGTDAGGAACRLRPRAACQASAKGGACPGGVASCCDVCGPLGCGTASTTTTTSPPAPVAHYEYVFPDGSFSVYDMDDAHQLVKTVALPQTQGVRGVVAHADSHSLYVSYGGDGDGDGQHGTPSLLKYDLVADAVVWTHAYPVGIDSMSISPDGSLIYMPTGELAAGGTWYVVGTGSGDVVGTIDGPRGPHNTIVSLDGGRVYLGGRGENELVIADTATRQVLRRLGPLHDTVRPFTINGRETIAYITVTGFRGFQIGDIGTGQVLRTVPFTGPNISHQDGPSAPSHGISLSPDERELYAVDWPDYVHVFDVSAARGEAPQQVADIALMPSMNHVESPCLYDCLADGWLQHSRDGRFVYVGDQGAVIDTATRRPVANLSTLANTRKMLEIDWSQGVPVFAANARASVGYVR